MIRIYFSLVFLFSSMTCLAQWGQVNNGLLDLSSGAKLLGSSNTHLFSGTLGSAKMYRTSDNGNNWTEIQPPVASNVPECGYYFGGRYFAGLNASADCIFFSSDNGSSWNSVTGGPQTTVVRGFKGLSGNIFAFTSNLGISRSTDGGSTWALANTGLTNLNVIGMEVINTKLIAATIGGGIFISTDNGGSWAQSNAGIGGGDLNAEFAWRMGADLYYTAQGGGSYSSTDEGASWSSWVKPAQMGLGVTEIYRNGTNLYLEARHFSGGLRDSIYISADEGVSWTNITANLSASDLNASGITEFGGYAFTAYNVLSPNLGIYRRTTTVGLDESVPAASIIIYPNPFNAEIVLSNPERKAVELVRVYDGQGRLVHLGSGMPDSIDASGLGSGVYVIQVVFTDHASIQRKLVKF